MNDYLTDIDESKKTKPRSFWWIVILYAISIVIVYYQNINALQDHRKSTYILNSVQDVFFISIDFLQILILFGFYKKLKIAWSSLVLIHSMFLAIFFRIAYYITVVQNVSLLDLIKVYPLPIYYVANSTTIFVLAFQPRLLTFFSITAKQRLLTVVLLPILIILILIFYKIP